MFYGMLYMAFVCRIFSALDFCGMVSRGCIDSQLFVVAMHAPSNSSTVFKA